MTATTQINSDRALTWLEWQIRRSDAIALLIVLGSVICGCGPGNPQVAKVSGHLSLDGTALTGAALLFLPENGGRAAAGVTDSAGNYRLTTFNADDGALLGHHTVTISKRETFGVPTTTDGPSLPAEGGIRVRSLIPELYSMPDKSGLAADVRREANRFDFELSSQPAGE